MTKRIAYVTNNAYDSILLLDGDLVVSQWDVVPAVLTDYLRDRAEPDLWDVQDLNGIEHAPKLKDWGEELEPGSQELADRIEHKVTAFSA